VHQDDGTKYHLLSRESQLNCAMDYKAKTAILSLNAMSLPRQQRFPLEPICVFIGNNKLTADMHDHLQYWAHLKLARSTYHSLGILNSSQFDLVDWEMVYALLRHVPKLFQLWACKQVTNIAATNANVYRWDKLVGTPLCPNCMQVPETCAHVLYCCHDGRVQTLFHTIDLMDEWLGGANTESILHNCLVEYAKGRGRIMMSEICYGMGKIYTSMAADQDHIGWRQFMEGMVCTRIRGIQEAYSMIEGMHTSASRWTTGLILKLLKTTHRQWLYQNVQVYDAVAGTRVTLRKEQIQWEIEHQMELGASGLLQEDKYLIEINLEDMETTSGERQEYWLLAITAAQEASLLQQQQRLARNSHQERNQMGTNSCL
jgi:hypothetical protein